MKDEDPKYRLTGADFAVKRRMIGLTMQEISTRFGVSARTVRSWESGSEPIPYRITDEMGELLSEHDALVEEILYDPAFIEGAAVDIPRKSGWHLAAAARAHNKSAYGLTGILNHEMTFEWSQA